MNKSSIWSRFSSFFANEDNVSARRKIFSSLWAILIGILISSVLLLFLKINPLRFFAVIIGKSLHPRFINRFLVTIAVLIFSSIAVGIGFKAGMFNIGIPGQMMASGITSVVIIAYWKLSASSLAVSLIAGMLVALITGAIAGILKAYLNINEVVVTILLNWIVFYICWQLLSSDHLPFKNDMASVSGQSILLGVPALDTIWMSLIIMFGAIAFAIVMWFVLKRTTIGYRIKMTGFNKDASIYSGTNEKLLIITLMGFSAMVAGIAGFLWFVFEEKQMILSSGPVSIGFDSIAVSLLAHNSPIGSIFTSIFYSFITVGSVSLQSLNSLLDQSTVQIITGIIIYLSAISVIFSKFRLVSRIVKLWILIKSKAYFILPTNKKLLDNLQKQKMKIETLLTKHHLNTSKVMILEDKLSKLNIKIATIENESDKCDCHNLIKLHYKALSTKIFDLSNQKSQNKFNYKESKEYLSFEISNLNSLIESFTNSIKQRKIAILRGYLLVRYFLFIRFKRNKKLNKIINSYNKEQWKLLRNKLKNMLSVSTRKMHEEEKLHYFKKLSIEKRSVNHQLANLGFFDQKAIKEQYKTQVIDIKNIYSNAINDLIQEFKDYNKWFKMEVM
ncbi:ABC transporter permease [Mycoplasma phocimorsus]|uniref:ABC transporter permease n=1 Tax=Mycoplasma phocimorsus TaxID=3045839 RepID=UPI0024C0E50F|nr:hypothetical protein [Mycoplasma phocimorsus]MDJ1647762.1 hypothetical protein [Mycoplasma phocimorsus]